MKTGLKLIIVVALQSLAILAMVGGKVQTLMTGDVIILRTVPVDPRSLFRGDFVRLRYEITRLKGDEVSFQLDDLHPGRTIYVRLREEEGAWGAVSVHGEHPGPAADFKVIRGRIAASDMEDLFSGRWESAQGIPPARRKPPVRVLLVYY
ncbi:MAG: GDYXXLXY domain-containing protein, partial [Alphaproteobacteria bacterium]